MARATDQDNTQLSGSDSDAQAPEECPQGREASASSKDPCDSATNAVSSWNADEVIVAGSSEAVQYKPSVGQCTLFPHLETIDQHVILQPGDSFRHGKSVPIFLGAIHDGKKIKLLCVSSRDGSSAKTIPLHWYKKVSSGEPSPCDGSAQKVRLNNDLSNLANEA